MAKDGKDSVIIKVNDISNEDSIKKYGQGMDQISGDINSIILIRQMVAIIHESIIRCEQYNHKLGLQLMDQMNKMQEYATNVRDKLLEMDNNLEDLKEKSKWKGRAAIRRLRMHRAKLCHRFVCCMIDYNNIQDKYKSKYIQLLRTQLNIAKLPVNELPVNDMELEVMINMGTMRAFIEKCLIDSQNANQMLLEIESRGGDIIALKTDMTEIRNLYLSVDLPYRVLSMRKWNGKASIKSIKEICLGSILLLFAIMAFCAIIMIMI